MAYLSAQDPNFAQVVAIDAAFAVFTRAWCMAEISAANVAGMPQRLKLRSQDTLHAHLAALRELQVCNMEASYPEDKVEILQHIGDTDAFDRKLRQVLLE